MTTTPAWTTRMYAGAADLADMQSALATWIHRASDCGYCHVGDLPHRIYNGLRRYVREDLIRLWSVDGTLAGMVLVYPDHKAFDAFAAPDHRATALEREMLVWGADNTRPWLDRDKQPDRTVETDVMPCDTARASLLRELGFIPADQPWLIENERAIYDDLPPVHLPDGYTIRAACDDSDAAGLAAVHSGAFGSEWTPEMYRDHIMRNPGYDPALEHVVVAPDGSFAAFIIIWLDHLNRAGLFEPVGTHQDYHRRGLGRALMAHGLRVMRDHGMTAAKVCNEADNPAAQGLYAAMGFTPKHQFIAWREPASA